MLFQDLLNKKYKALQQEFELLFDDCLKNQVHPGDLLLIRETGAYNPIVKAWNNFPEKPSPYVIGPGLEGHSENTHYDFIGKYVKNNILNIPFSKYLEEIKYDTTRIDGINEIEGFEAYSIQIEMLIYLKIWESDSFINTFYQLARLVNSESYDWHFKIDCWGSLSDIPPTGSRGKIIREFIRDKFESSFPVIFKSFDSAYKSQIRNAIAHSQYILLGRNICLNNYNRDKYSKMPSVSYDEWINIFHDSIIIYSLYNEILTKVSLYYREMASHNDNIFEVKINRLDPVEDTEYRLVEYHPTLDVWSWEID